MQDSFYTKDTDEQSEFNIREPKKKNESILI